MSGRMEVLVLSLRTLMNIIFENSLEDYFYDLHEKGAVLVALAIV